MKPQHQNKSSAPRTAYRIPILLLGLATLVAGVLAGLLRLGWDLPSPSPTLVQLHGPLMIACFFGVVIGLERAVALGKPLAYLAPIITGISGVSLILGAPVGAAQIGLVIGATLFVYASLSVLTIQLASHTVLLAVGALTLLLGDLLWGLGYGFEAILPWWVSFLVITIVAERLELTRLRPLPQKAKTVFFVLIGLYLIAATALSTETPYGGWLFGGALIAIALWLIKYDIARITVRQQGLVRYIAICLLSGYGWLMISGVIWALSGGVITSAYAQDAALHSVFLGFVFAMVFGHAPIILPAVSRLSLPYHWRFYAHLLVLELSLVLRVVADLAELDDLRAIAGMGNMLTLALFILNTLYSVRQGFIEKSKQANRHLSTAVS